MKHLGVIANTGKPRAAAVLERLDGLARSLGLSLSATAQTAALLPGAAVIADGEAFRAVDAVLALGGDGTMLAAVRSLHGLNKPLIGVNIGSLGFMTSVSEQDMERALRCLRDETYIVSERSVAECVVRTAGGEIEQYRALNDVVVSSGASSRVVRLEVSAGESLVTTYVCDGLIVSTPTGSTGHSLSSGGPIMLPETHAFVISVICPHTLSSRPLVVPDQTVIRVRVCAAMHDHLRLSVDGQVGRELKSDDVVEVRRCERNVRFLHLPDYDYFSVLRRKLNWSGSTGMG
jgi:NAD+ kinase